MSDDDRKRLKLDVPVKCIICDSEGEEPLTFSRDEPSWTTLYKAAVIRDFSPILKLPADTGKS